MKGKPASGRAQVTVRPMAGADIDAVLALEHDTPTAPHWSSAGYQACVGTQGGNLQYFGLVAAVGGEVAGFAVVRHLRIEARAGGDAENECELESIVVTEKFRRDGIGFRLLAAAVALARDRQANRMILEVRESNLPAIRLYERAGLGPDGRRPAYYVDPVEDAVLMSMDLSG